MNKKISIVFPNWAFSKSGGSRVKSMLANEFQSKGYKVLFLCYYKSDELYYPVDCEIRYVDENGRTVSRVAENPPKGFISSLKDMHDRYIGLKKGLDAVSDEYNVVIANMALTAYSVYKSRIKNKFYYIQAYEAWENAPATMKNVLKNWIIKKTYSLPLIRIVNADIYKNYKEIRSQYVVPPGLDLSIYYPKKEYWDRKRSLVIGCIGRKEEWKGSNDVATAIKIVRERGYSIKYKVAFNPVNCDDYELVSPDGDVNLANFYRSLDIMVAPATLQLGAIHYPVIEAMACGIPLVTTGYYPANECNSYLVPISSPCAIAERLIYMINNYDEAIAKAQIALEEIQRFDWDIVSDHMLNIMQMNISK